MPHETFWFRAVAIRFGVVRFRSACISMLQLGGSGGMLLQNLEAMGLLLRPLLGQYNTSWQPDEGVSHVWIWFLLGAGWKSHYVTLTSHCHKWHRVSMDVGPGQGRRARQRCLSHFKIGKKKKKKEEEKMGIVKGKRVGAGFVSANVSAVCPSKAILK